MAGYIPSRNGRVHLGQDTCWQRHNHISARNDQVHLGQDTCWQCHNHILAKNGRVYPVQEWSGTSWPTTLFLSFILDFTHFSLLFHFVHYETGGLVLVYGRVHPGPIRQKWSGSPRPKYEAHSLWSNHWGICFSPFLQHNTEGPIRVMAGYIPVPFGRVHPSPMM